MRLDDLVRDPLDRLADRLILFDIVHAVGDPGPQTVFAC